MQELLFEYRYIIWLIGGLVTAWIVLQLPGWLRIARGGTWNAERDYASWRVRNSLLALALLLPLLLATTATAFSSLLP